jgi:competence ComEA-like helix-hairpin-helix protein
VVLILVLWAIAVLALLAGGVSFAIRQDVAVANIEGDRLAAHWLARAGVERAIAELTDDNLNNYDHLDEFWADYPAGFENVELAGGTFSVMRDGYEVRPVAWYGAADESAKLNASVATIDQLMDLPDMTRPIASAIVDWRDRNEDPQPEGIEGGHYSGLAHPYRIRNGPFRTVREILLVRGVTGEQFYKEDLNANGRLDPNENDGSETAPADNRDGRLDRGWFAFLTTYSYDKNVDATGEKRLNLNDVDANRLATRTRLESWAAESIVQARGQRQFEHLIDLLKVTKAQDVAHNATDNDFFFRSDEDRDRPVTVRIFQAIVDKLTLKNDEMLPGRININTAPREVLVTLPGIDDERADAIVQYREGGGMFTSIGDLLDISSITQETFGSLEDSITVRSNVFRIRSEGKAASGLAVATIECVVDRGGEVPRILYWLESTP